MGFIRSILVTLISVLLFLTLLSTNTFFTFTNSLEYETLEPELTSAVTEIVNDSIDLSVLDDNLPAVAVYCNQPGVSEISLSRISDQIQEIQENQDMEVINNSESDQIPGENLSSDIEEYGFSDYVIPCNMITQGSTEIISYLVSKKIEGQYYKEYDCEFWDCVSTSEIPFFLISQKARDYWKGWFYWAVLASIVLAIILFVFIEVKSSGPFFIGGLLIIASLPFLGMGWLLTLVSGWTYARILTLFFTKSFVTFLISFTIGIVFILIGIVLKFLDIGNKISGWFNIGKSSKPSKSEKPEKSSKSPKS
ncbi:hypothetical protein GF378_02335 [Candidatus Pacearchaeota archaeon]|nr:hypothetical protein [Candidatus Pacearchaeota archaeon]